MPESSVRLGERLLGLIPRPKGPRQPKTKKQSLSALSLAFGLLNSLSGLLCLTVLAALCGTGVLTLLNMEAKAIEGNHHNAIIGVLFVLLLLVYRTSQNYLIKSVSREVEDALDRQRQRIVEKTLALSLREIEEIGRDQIRDGISGHYTTLSQTIVPIVSAFESLILATFLFGYLVYLSMFAASIVILVNIVLAMGFLNRQRKMSEEIKISDQVHSQYRRLTNAIVGGTKELQLGLARRMELSAKMSSVSSAVAKGRKVAASHFADLIATGTTAAYLMAGAVVFVMPILIGDGAGEDMSKIVIAVVFLLGPIGSVVNTMQQVSLAQFALNAINNFELEITHRTENISKSADSGPPIKERKTFHSISLESTSYTHAGQDGFSLQNINLKIHKGEVIFLTGGNGSGKTTLLNILTGLYPREAGNIILNDQKLPIFLPQQYRELFASVFTDFFMFDQPFGLDEEGIAIFEKWLVRFNVRDYFRDDLQDLSGVELSTGQRKRVALALAIAEQRPILILDEWAADQDPDTRRKFYEEIIPMLKKEGFTIFAITHDERYFHCCDRRLHIVEGELTQEISS
jgi:putative ATP-binding cassette transporter